MGGGDYFQQLSISLIPNSSDQQFIQTVQKYLNLSFIAEFADFVIFKAKFYWRNNLWKKISLYLPTYLFFWTTYQKVCYYQKIKNQPPFEYSGHLTFYHSGGGGSNPAMSTFDYLSMCLPFLYYMPTFSIYMPTLDIYMTI